MAAGVAAARALVDEHRRGYHGQRTQQVRIQAGQHHAEGAAQRFATIVDRRVAQVGNDGAKIGDAFLGGQLRRQVEVPA